MHLVIGLLVKFQSIWDFIKCGKRFGIYTTIPKNGFSDIYKATESRIQELVMDEQSTTTVRRRFQENYCVTPSVRDSILRFVGNFNSYASA